MSAVASKNLFELLGNTHDEDSDKEAEPPVKAVEKSIMRTSKRNGPDEVSTHKAPGAYDGKRETRGPSGNEGAFRDRNAGSARNRGKPTDVDDRGKQYRSNDGRGQSGRGGPRNYDRHSRGVVRDSEKQVGHGWGANEGKAELYDEQAGEALAKADKADITASGGHDTTPEAAIVPEPEDNSISYADYLLQQQEKKAALLAQAPQLRKPNEGTNQDKKWSNAKPITREDEENFFQGSGGKVKRERERRQKQVIEIDQRFIESSDRGARGGRGGNYQGGRSNRGGRGDNYQRDSRGGGGGRNPEPNISINPDDDNAFPILGS